MNGKIAKSGRIKAGTIGNYALFIGPTMVLFTLLFLIPMVSEIFYSFTNWNGIDPTFDIIGIKNYIRAIEDETYWTSFWFTIKFSIFVVLFSNVIGFAWAYVLSGDIPYKNFWRALIYAPRIIGGVVLGFLWRFIFQNVFVQFGEWTGISWFSQQWFTTPESSFWALVIVMTWSLSGYLMIIYNSGLAAISKDYYEAAIVDGATKWDTLKSITLPLLKGTTARCLFIAINWAMLLYDTNISLTNGNPYRTSEGVMMNIYATAFRSNQISYGAAKSILFIIVLLIISFGQMKLTARNEVKM
ncbi:MAG TPA: sugar ABC transporter permease [Candidatus Enterocloster excrementipullorum]|uniref:Sugar ABC transporter permease n=1 Tax=Candidatus Enterocloster excrementipullorum TaxID=2838559 RepID=A0A9D2N0I1_9FIRM|nr:sugar ABC transporter permease [Candidatus Enterocloster excrementipullorum]